MNVGLRIDIDTCRGTEHGLPTLCCLLREHGITATIFCSVGPDNMGRHLWRLARPTFLVKMLRSRAASLYGWSTLLSGTMWPGPVIGQRHAEQIRAAAQEGHEIGFHAWDHHAWQARVHRMSADDIAEITRRGIASLTAIVGAPPTCAAAPGWCCNDVALRAQAAFPFTYQSDCRGDSVFLPEVDGEVLLRPQIPVTLPTYDEVIGRDGVSDQNYNDQLLARLAPDRLNVLTIHAEVEGIARADLFKAFLDRATASGVRFVPLRALLPAPGAELPRARVIQGRVPGRDGPVACQAPALHTHGIPC